ncbi:MAG: DUF2500 domain-containing protein [Defluviitaleaceae bacterium]|nr:DUF2500 domain-containing protein [Defluviitaleaceae bacterium]
MEISFGSVIIVAVVGFAVARFIWFGVQRLRSHHMPVATAEAHVVKVFDKTGSYRVGLREYHSLTPGYEVTFEMLSNAKRKRFFVPEKHGRVAKGDIGILTTQGICFIRFERSQGIEN